MLQWDEFSQDDIPLRGGSHRDSAWSLRSTYPSQSPIAVWETGFRPARTLVSTEAEFTRPALQLVIPVQVGPSLYDDVGKYQIPGDIMLSITKHDGHLFIHVTGHPKYTALTAMSENRFFVREVPVGIEFVWHHNGEVIHLHHRRFNWKDIAAPRIRSPKTLKPSVNQ